MSSSSGRWRGRGKGKADVLFRFHAWQSALLFSAIFVVHLIFSWSSWISYTFLVMDILLIAYLVRKAYVDGWCFFSVFSSLCARDKGRWLTMEKRTRWIDARSRCLGHWQAEFSMTSESKEM